MNITFRLSAGLPIVAATHAFRIGFLVAFWPVVLLAQNSAVKWHVFDAGFGLPKSSTTLVKSAVGQTFVGRTQQGNTRMEVGFLADSLFRSLVVGVGRSEQLPTEYALSQNYPNPFNPSTTIAYELPRASLIEIEIFNLLGQKIATLVNEERVSGRHTVVWNGRDENEVQVGSGVYFYRIRARELGGTREAEYMLSKKLILLK